MFEFRNERIKRLVNEMNVGPFKIWAFRFNYNGNDFDVLISVINDDLKFKSIAKLTFSKINENEFVDIYLFKNGWAKLVTDNNFYDFFGIENNGGHTGFKNIFADFLSCFYNNFVYPTFNFNNLMETSKRKLVSAISTDNNDDSKKIYFTHLMFNDGKRSMHNNEKAAIFVDNDIYMHFRNVTDQSFCFSENKDLEEKSLVNVIKKFRINQNKRNRLIY